MKAFVLINSDLGKEPAIMEALSKVDEIKSIHALYGIYDLIAEVETDSMEKVKEIVFNKIRRLNDVKTTITLITYGEPLMRD
jgi:DNA-binding Lrp family transcriptional regulator